MGPYLSNLSGKFTVGDKGLDLVWFMDNFLDFWGGNLLVRSWAEIRVAKICED
jgi:hypothetical protein